MAIAGAPKMATVLSSSTGNYIAGATMAPRVIQAGSPATMLPATVISSPVTSMPIAMASTGYVRQGTTVIQAAPTFQTAPAAPVTYTSRALAEDRVIRAPAVYKGKVVEQLEVVQQLVVVEQLVDIGGGVLIEQEILVEQDVLVERDILIPALDEPSMFEQVPVAAPDAILTLATWFKEDKFEKKVNLGIGAYRTEEGKPWPLPSVLAAQLAVVQDPSEDKEYVPIDGKPEYKKPVQQLIFSEAEIESGNLATTQAISGTGSLQMIGQFLKNNMNCDVLNIPNPTWGNHTAIFKRAGVTTKAYTYYKPETRGFDFEGMMEALNAMPAGEAVLLHACAQNPTGVDPTPEQWAAIVEVCGARGLIPVLDNAYQGYASGSLEKDGLSMKMFEEAGLEYFVAQSFAKNFGLYGERIGYIHVRCSSPHIAKAVLSQLKILIRQAYSSPPRHGAAIVNRVLTTPELKAQWLGELQFMSDRILQMRDALRGAVEARETPGTWNHITDQIGMFSYTGLNTAQVERMVNEFHIYMTKDGRISVAGLNPGNVDYVAECIDTVVRS